jgi:hypothetical protein
LSGKSRRSFRASRLVEEGRIAIVTTREAGMRWTRVCLLTSGTEADGEVVWSWRAHAGAKLATMLMHRGLRRWQTSWFTEESAK